MMFNLYFPQRDSLNALQQSDKYKMLTFKSSNPINLLTPYHIRYLENINNILIGIP